MCGARQEKGNNGSGHDPPVHDRPRLPRPCVVMSSFVIALLVALAVGGQTYDQLTSQPYEAKDFTWIWRAGQDLLGGQNPYRNPALGGRSYPNDAPLFYPLPAVLVGLPLTPLPVHAAGATFAGISSGVLAFGLLRRYGPSGLLALLTPMHLTAASNAQWSPLLVGVALLWRDSAVLGLIKPNIGAALFAMRPSIQGIGIAMMVGFVSLAVLPTWPVDWFSNMGQSRHTIPALALPFGPLLGAAWLARHRPEGRLLIAMACLPQRMMFYDQLPLMLVAQSARQRLLLAYASVIVGLAWLWTGGVASRHLYDDVMTPWTLAGCYLPALSVAVWNRMRADDAERIAAPMDGSTVRS